MLHIFVYLQFKLLISQLIKYVVRGETETCSSLHRIWSNNCKISND